MSCCMVRTGLGNSGLGRASSKEEVEFKRVQ